MRTIPNYIAGRHVEPIGKEYLDKFEPATGRVIGSTSYYTPSAVNRSVAYFVSLLACLPPLAPNVSRTIAQQVLLWGGLALGWAVLLRRGFPRVAKNRLVRIDQPCDL